jgi:LmbE family N-acetylglucosaminyl deacetylase
MTSGNKGSRQEQISETELTKTRLSENTTSMQLLGIRPEDDVCLEIGDGQIENDLTTIGKLALQIRLFQPELIITHNPEHAVVRYAVNENWVNHRDHRHTGLSALDAAYPYSRDLLFFPEHFKNPAAKSHNVNQFLLVDFYNHPDEVGIDVTKVYDQKVSSIAAHTSQFSTEKAKDIADFMTSSPDGVHYERFRYVVAD